MTEAVLAEGGTIDKYVGDPRSRSGARRRGRPCGAPAAPPRLTKALRRLNDSRRPRPRPFRPAPPGALLLAMGVGINTGECLVGNLGSSHRFHSAPGDAASSSRIESPEALRHPIIISDRPATWCGLRRLRADAAAVGAMRR
jgi:adenylate cyclase